jgi:translation initiation factor 2-alpha kinase 3
VPKVSFFRHPDTDSEDDQIVARAAGLDALVFIKMDVYSMTLDDFIWGNKKGEHGGAGTQHCFHTLTTARILDAILDGVEYIHEHGMVHRDLKPGNILLSICQDPKSPPGSSIDITSCPECANGPATKQTFITPHIGDFGLVAEIKEPPQPVESAGPSGQNFQPTELARLVPRSAVGSKLYLPRSNTEIICPKLDVYSLGVIAFELAYKFGTRAERCLVLERLRRGQLPPGLESHEMAAGFKGMACDERDERWDCKAVRAWLGDIKKRYESEG